jgi:hypothetical protein
VPKTRQDLGLPTFDPSGEDSLGSTVSEKVKKELWEALGDSPIGAAILGAGYLVSIARLLRPNVVLAQLVCSSNNNH